MTLMKNSCISLINMSKKFVQGNKTLTVLDTIHVNFMQGHSYAITGVSGSGKSTLMHIIAGIDTPTHGTVAYNNIPLSSLSENQLSAYLNSSIGLVFQSPYLIAELSVVENVMLPARIAQQAPHESLHKAQELLAYVGLTDYTNSKPKSLSGGQQQRVAIARALMNNPTFLIADEPTGNLDYHTGTKIISLLHDCQKKWGMGILISSHDAYVTEQMDTAYELKDGKLSTLI
jgi:putative ABC transport system ATP-binding protein